MALVQRYINTASTPGGDGTTNATTGANRAYASMTEWEAAEQTNLVSDGDVHKVTCSGGEDPGAVVVSGWTGNATSYLIIEVDDASYHGMQLGVGYRITADGSFTTAFDLENVDATIIDGLSVERTGASGTSGNGMEIFSSPGAILVNCIIANDTNTADYATAAVWNRGNGATGAWYINCLALNSGLGFGSSGFSEGFFYNCNAVDNGTGFKGPDQGARLPTAINCLTFGNTTSWSADPWEDSTSSHNATDDATVPTEMAGADGGTNEATLVTGVVSGDLEDYANDDFRLASGSALIDVGKDIESTLSALSRTDYTLAIKDAFGNDRPQGAAWDIGFHEFVSGGGIAPLTAETGTFGVSGNDATLSRSYVLTAERGTFALAGQDADLLRSLRLAADTGSFALTGQDAEFRRGFRLIAETGTFTVTGQEIAFSRNYVLAAETGVFTLTGNEANLAAGQRLEAETGSFALTGNDATLRRSYVLTAETASFAVTGNDAALAKGYRLTAETGSFALTGTDVAFSRSYVIAAETGTFTLTGFAASISADEVLLASTGAFSFTGNDADLRVKRRLSVETGAFLVSGQDAGLNASRLISAAPAAFQLTAQDAGLLRGYAIAAETGEFVLSPFAAELRRDAILDAGTGSFTLTGIDADLRISGEFDRIFTPRSGLFSRRAGAFTPRGSLFTRRQ